MTIPCGGRRLGPAPRSTSHSRRPRRRLPTRIPGHLEAPATRANTMRTTPRRRSRRRRRRSPARRGCGEPDRAHAAPAGRCTNSSGDEDAEGKGDHRRPDTHPVATRRRRCPSPRGRRPGSRTRQPPGAGGRIPVGTTSVGWAMAGPVLEGPTGRTGLNDSKAARAREGQNRRR